MFKPAPHIGLRKGTSTVTLCTTVFKPIKVDNNKELSFHHSVPAQLSESVLAERSKS